MREEKTGLTGAANSRVHNVDVETTSMRKNVCSRLDLEFQTHT